LLGANADVVELPLGLRRTLRVADGGAGQLDFDRVRDDGEAEQQDDDLAEAHGCSVAPWPILAQGESFFGYTAVSRGTNAHTSFRVGRGGARRLRRKRQHDA